MKNKTLKILSLALAVTTTLSTSIPVFAYDVDEHDNSIESVEYQNTEDEDFSNVTNVFAQLGSEYKVTIPKVIVLSGASKDARFFVKVAGDIAGYEKVTVTPDDNFKLYAKNKDSQTATVNQDKTVWTVHDFDTDANGLVEAKNITAGKWKGTFNFNINLEDGEKVAGDIIIPPVDEWNSETVGQDITLKVGETGYPEVIFNGKNILADCSISSSNEEIAQIEKQNIKALKVGTSKITISYGVKNYAFNVNVVEDSNMKVHIHIPKTAIRENEIAATYKEDGSYDEVTYCADCGEELSRVTKTIDKLEVTGGLFDENDNLIKSWDELLALGLDVNKAYDYKTCKTEATSGYSVFENNNLSGKLVIPDSVTSIGEYAFAYCTSLTSVTIPNSVTSISKSAFNNCTSLKEVKLPDSLTSIGYAAFGACIKLESVVIPDSVTNIDEFAFNLCKSLTSIIIPDSVTSISNAAFNGCTSLESIIIPDSVTSIGQSAFLNCTSLTSITIPNSVKTISTYAFNGCTSLESITIPDSVTSIGNGVFLSCTSLESIIIPDSVTSIGNQAFQNCTSLKSITIPNSVTSIVQWAFVNCASLESVTIPNSVTSIGENVFKDCTSLKSVTYRGVTYTDKTTFNNKLKSDGVATTKVWN